MKDLPPDPPVYTPPKEQWFQRHEHAVDGTMAAAATTLSAMRLLVYDRMKLQVPEKQPVFSALERSQLDGLVRMLGPHLMSVWRASCDNISREESDPVKVFNRMLNKGDLVND